MLKGCACATPQVELNTIASSFGCLSTLTSGLHRYILQRSSRSEADLNRLPANDATGELADAIGAAVREFGVEGAAVLFVVQPNERNSYDQQVCSSPMLAYELMLVSGSACTCMLKLRPQTWRPCNAHRCSKP
jgi:hypothetical protein